MKLLCGLYEPSEGRILLNGVDISEIKYSEYIKYFTAVFQDFKLFPFTLKENIVLNRNYTIEEIESAIEKSGFMEKFNELPKGLNTILYKKFDDEGIELSGGEMQKVAIARAICKDTPIVILDEPTASLDPVAEFEIYTRFNDIAKNKTSIFISHRLSSTRFSDRIFVFDKGEIIECGTHTELLIKNGLYNEMFTKQAKYYIKDYKLQ